MKYLKIENNKGFYFSTKEEVNKYVEIDKITKEDLLVLMEKVISEDFEMDDYEEAKLSHKAHQIVYKSISEKFSDLRDNKTQFADECDAQYKAAIEKYESESE